MLHKQSDIEKRVRDVIAENPNLPILVLSDDVNGEYESYYHFVTHASVEDMVFPAEVKDLYGDTFGLDEGRWYEIADVADEIESWLWDFDHGSEFYKGHGPRNQYSDWAKIYSPIANMMAEDMPSYKYVVIRAEM